MSEQRISDGFIDDLSAIHSEALRQRIRSLMHSLVEFPGMGSTQVPRSVVETYGSGVRKVAARPFDLIYRYDEARDIVFFEALIHMKMRR